MNSTKDKAPTDHPQSSSTIPTILKTEHGTTSLPTPPFSRSTSNTSSDVDEGGDKLQRPKLVQRKSSGSIIIPRTAPTIGPKVVYPPDDARAMSPRRSVEENEEIVKTARQSLENRVKQMQSGLAAIAAEVESVSANCDSLEGNNLALQQAIGDMTRSLSRQGLNK
ncbi:MAG: hypothetical protein LQ350_000066 [Teloschistes chrysophthalmus]|nr:MAG: hypothetical protein LQ350_000066 [Niorma chrysophthalma]